MKRVLIIDNSRNITGAFRSIVNFSKALKGQIDFYYAVPTGCWLEIPEVPLNRLFAINYLELEKTLRVLWYLPRLVVNTLKVSSIIKKHSIEVVHVGDLYNMVGICLKFIHKDLNLVYHVRLRKDSYVGVLYDLWLALIKMFADDIICVSKVVAEDAKLTGKAHLIYDGVTKDWLAPPLYSIRDDSSRIRLLYVGNYIRGKGQDLALIALRNALEQNSRLTLKFIGGDLNNRKNKAFLETLKTTTSRLNLSNQVVFGPESMAIAEEMSACDLILNFSESESFSMVCLEALARRIPVIASRSGGPEEIIRHKVNGLLVNNGDTMDMAKSIILLASDEKLRSSFSKNAHLDFHEKFNLEKLSQKLKQVYLGPEVTMDH